MMDTALARLLVWILGCVFFDGVMQLQGAWLMLGGAVTYSACEMAARTVKALRA
jgi:hypothetical protein